MEAAEGGESGVFSDRDMVRGGCDGGSSGGATASMVVVGSVMVSSGRIEWLEMVTKEVRSDGSDGECGLKTMEGRVEVVLICILLSALTEIAGWGDGGGW